MADVFISYKSDDRAAARLYADALVSEGISVWWDPALRTGETYDEVIERNLREASIVVVLWSPRSVRSKWVRAEATIGERKGGLLPVLIEQCERPVAFELTQTADLRGWAGDRSDARWVGLISDLRDALSSRQAEVRAHTAPAPPDPLMIETLFWNSIKDGNDAADLESYLHRYPHGHFIEIARNRIGSLKITRSPAIEPANVEGVAEKHPSEDIDVEFDSQPKRKASDRGALFTRPYWYRHHLPLSLLSVAIGALSEWLSASLTAQYVGTNFDWLYYLSAGCFGLVASFLYIASVSRRFRTRRGNGLVVSCGWAAGWMWLAHSGWDPVAGLLGGVVTGLLIALIDRGI